MKNFKTLELAIKFYRECEKLKMKKHLRDQLLRSSSSVALNLTEGNSKNSIKDRRKYFMIAYASLKESQTALILANINSPDLHDLIDHIGACIFKLNCAQEKWKSVF